MPAKKKTIVESVKSTNPDKRVGISAKKRSSSKSGKLREKKSCNTFTSLNLSKEQLSQMLYSAPIVVMLANSRGEICGSNKLLNEIREISSGQALMPGDFLDCVNSLDGRGRCGSNPACIACPLRNAILDTLKTGEPHMEFEFHLERHRGGSRYQTCLRTSTILVQTDPEPIVAIAIDDISRNKLTEQLIKTIESNLKEAQNLAHIGSWEWDPEKGRLFWSDEIYRIFGVEKENSEPSIDSFEQAIHPEDLDRFIADRERWTKENRTVNHSYRVILPDGRIRHIQQRVNSVEDNDGNSRKVIGTIQDISENISSAEALYQSEERFRNMAEQLKDVLYQTDKKGIITYISPSASEVFGYTPEEMTGRNFVEFLSSKHAQRAGEAFQRAIGGGAGSKNLDLLMKRKDGTIFPGELTGRRFEKDGITVGTIGIIRDISERKAVAEALQHSEERLSRIISEGPIGVATLSTDFKFLTANSSFCKMTGYSSQELQNMTPADIAYDGDPEKEIESVERLLRGEIPANKSEKRYVRKDGEVIWTSVTCVAIRDSEHRFLYYLAMVDDISERKKAEEILRESESRYRTLFEKAGDYVILLEFGDDDIPVIIDINESGLKAHGYSREELIGKKISILDSGLTQEVSKGRVQNVLENDKGLFTVRHRRKNGTHFYAEVQAHRVQLKNKMAILSIERDITRRLLMQGILDARIRLLQQASSLALEEIITATLDEIEILTESNMGFYHFVEPDQKKLSSRNWSTNTRQKIRSLEGSPKPAKSGKEELWDECIRKREPVIRNQSDKKSNQNAGLGIFREAVVPIFRGATIKAVIGVGNKASDYTSDDIEILSQLGDLSWDIVEKMLAESALRDSEEKFRKIAENINEVICQIDLDGKILYVSPAVLRNFGYRTDEIIDRNIFEFIPEDNQSEVQRVLDKLRSGCEQPGKCLHLIRNDGSIADIETSFVAVYKDGRIVAAQGVMRDITETKRLRELESRALRLETAGKIAGQVAHDFNNLLGPIIAYPMIIKEELPETHPALTFVKDIETAAAKIAEINQQLLTLGRRGHYAQAPVNINSIIKQAIKDLMNLPDTVELKVNLAAELFNISGGSAQLYRAIMNLLLNARDAVGNSGEITIATENCYIDENQVSYGRIPKGEYIRATISDTGIGITDEIAGKIFDPFFSTKTTEKERGSGLGLSVVDAVVKDHSGYIDLKSKVGEGTSFYLYFPAIRDNVETAESPENIEGNESLLIVDDDNMQREVGGRILSRLGYKVSTADSGENAIEMVKTGNYDLLLLDMVMPGGIDGAETYRRILEIKPDQKAIIVSGFAETERVRFAQSLGAITFVKKPLTMKSIGSAIRREMRNKELIG